MAAEVEVNEAIHSLFQISARLFKVGKKSFRSLRTVKPEAKHLRNSVLGFSQILDSYCSTMSDLQTNGVLDNDDFNIRKISTSLNSGATEVLEQSKESFKRIKELGDPYASLLAHWEARIMWTVVDESDIKYLLAKLNTIKVDVTLITNVLSVKLQVRILNEMAKRHETPSQEMLAKLKILSDKNRSLKRMVKEAHKEIENLKASHTFESSYAPGQSRVWGRSLFRDVEEFQRSEKPTLQAARQHLGLQVDTSTASMRSNGSGSHDQTHGTPSPSRGNNSVLSHPSNSSSDSSRQSFWVVEAPSSDITSHGIGSTGENSSISGSSVQQTQHQSQQDLCRLCNTYHTRRT